MKIYKILVLPLLLSLTLGLSSNRSFVDDMRRVSFDVAVTDRKGNPVADLERRNFKVFVDGVEQALIGVSESKKNLAVVFVVELSDSPGYYMADSTDVTGEVLKSMGSEDWGAVVSFGIQPDIVVDFTHDRTELLTGVRRLSTLPWPETALFDSISFVLDRMRNLDQKGAIVVFATGRDTTSIHRTYGQALRRAETSGTSIYAMSLANSAVADWKAFPDAAEQFRIAEARNTLASFAEASGGLSFQPNFPGQFSEIGQKIIRDLRNQYTLTIDSYKADVDGKLRKLKVEVVDTDIDMDRKPDKLDVRHKEGILKVQNVFREIESVQECWITTGRSRLKK